MPWYYFIRFLFTRRGKPQGSVLSVTIFSIKINNILKQLPSTVYGSLHVVNLQISCQGKDVCFIERQLQIAISNIIKWTDTNGFNFSSDKTCCVHFCHIRGIFVLIQSFLLVEDKSLLLTLQLLGCYFRQKTHLHSTHIKFKRNM